MNKMSTILGVSATMATSACIPSAIAISRSKEIGVLMAKNKILEEENKKIPSEYVLRKQITDLNKEKTIKETKHEDTKTNYEKAIVENTTLRDEYQKYQKQRETLMNLEDLIEKAKQMCKEQTTNPSCREINNWTTMDY